MASIQIMWIFPLQALKKVESFIITAKAFF